MRDKIKQMDLKQKQAPLDFFGRAFVPRVRSETDKPIRNAKMEGKIVFMCHKNEQGILKNIFFLKVDTPKANVNYRYHEGFSNAVRKPMIVQMFL